MLGEVLPELKLLHEVVEENFDPFGLVKSAKEVIEKLKMHPESAQYIPCLEKRLVLRLLHQLAAVYRSVKIDLFHELLGDVTITSKEIEQLVVRSVKGCQLILRVDHMNGRATSKMSLNPNPLTLTFTSEMLCLKPTRCESS